MANHKLKFTDLSNPWQRFRSQTGMTQTALAELLQTKQTSISQYEAGDFPSPGVAKRFVALARRYKVRMDLDELYANLTA